MPTPSLPPPVERLATELAALPGARAVVLGGSRATGTHRDDSDWDLGIYYRSGELALDPADVRRLGYHGQVAELGEWGPIVHGGGWLRTEDTDVDVLFRDLDTIEAWRREAEHGRFEVLNQAGYLVGAPTYLPVGELAVCRPLVGELDQPRFPAALASAAPPIWHGQAGVALMFADGYAGLADVVNCAGMLVRAVLCTAHARLAGAGEWVLGEKRLVERTELHAAHGLLASPGTSSGELCATVAATRELLGTESLSKH